LAAISSLELLGEDVLKHLGFRVDAVPRHTETFDEVQLQQPMVAHHLERHPSPVVGQPHTAIGLVLDQPELAQALDHP